MTRRALGLVLSLCTALYILTPAAAVGADTSITPSAPATLVTTVAKSTRVIPSGSWTNTRQVDLHFQLQVEAPGVAVTPQVELQPSGADFTGQPNFTGPALTASGSAVVTVKGLRNGKKYHWQARVTDATGLSSPWVVAGDPAATTADFGVDLNPPSRPIISSSTNPDQNGWYHTSVENLSWTSNDPVSGIAGYSYVVERDARVIPPGSVTPQATVSLKNLSDGVWFLALRSVSHAGNWSPTATYRLQLDRQPPQITWLSPKRVSLNPFQGPVTVQFRVSKDANVHVALWQVGALHPLNTYTFAHMPAGQTASITWSGKGIHGKPVSKGYYYFAVTALDRASNLSHVNLGGIDLVPVQPHRAATGEELFPGGGKRIIVQLSRETLYAYDGDRLVLQTLVTTGNPNLPTPTGTYTITAKYTPFQFISPWPMGSKYYYAPSWSQHAMLFRDGGYFLHDAPWRSAFGPGTNGVGQPGTNYGGTHGCVNIPPGAMLSLWNWSPVGTTVEVVP